MGKEKTNVDNNYRLQFSWPNTIITARPETQACRRVSKNYPDPDSKSSNGPVNISTSLTCLFATDFNPHSARIASYNHGPKRKKHYRSTTIHDQASMGQSRPEDSSNRLNNQAGLKHGLALAFSRNRAQRASKSVRLARIKRCCSFPHDQFLLQLLLLLLFY